MPNLNSLVYGLISVLLALCTVFVFIDNDNRAIEIAKSKPLASYFRVCGHSPWVTVLSDTQFKFGRQIFDLEGVITQIKYEFYEYPFSTIGIHAKEEVSSGVVTRLTSDIKYVIPDSQIVWSYYK